MSGLRVILFDDEAGLSLFVRLPGSYRMLVDLGKRSSPGSLRFLREMGELTPLSPLSEHVRPHAADPDPALWLRIICLIRGLVFRPGGSWVFWQPESRPAPGYALKAWVVPRKQIPDPPPEMPNPPLLVLGLTPQAVTDLGGAPGDLVANSCLAVKITPPYATRNHLLMGGDLNAAAWDLLLEDQSLTGLLSGASRYAGGEEKAPEALAHGVFMAAFPWLALAALQNGGGWQACAGKEPVREHLSTPPAGVMSIEVADSGIMDVTLWPRAENRLSWCGLARPLRDDLLPAPWPLLRALAAA